MLEEEDVWLGTAIQFDRVLVIPLDRTLDGLTVLQNHDHRCLVLHLLHVIKVLRVRLIVRRWALRSRLPYSQLFLDLGKARPDQFPI